MSGQQNFFLRLIFFGLLSITAAVAASPEKLLDKILVVIDDQVITLSMIKRVADTIPIRKNISGMIFNKDSFSNEEIAAIIIRKNLIRGKLTEQGYIIGDDQVEAQIKDTEAGMGINREALLKLLTSNSFTFDEYFELVRESIEFNLFSSKVIQPLISVTEQEIKNSFYRENLNNKTIAFRYSLVDFSIAKKELKQGAFEEFKEALIKFQADGHLPEKYKSVDATTLGDVLEEGLTNELKSLLKKTDEGSFSEPFLMNDKFHVFFVKKKDLVESELFLKAKERIKNQLFDLLAKKMLDIWTQREKNKHYIKSFF